MSLSREYPPHEYLPATGRARQELVLLHGWGCHREVWRPLLVHLRPWANVTLLDVPGCAPGQPAAGLEAALDDILACCPGRAIYVGWSLGGQLALELASRNASRVSGVVTICSNPRFVADGDWPGMAPEVFRSFYDEVESDPGAGLKRFRALEVQGARLPRALLRQLRQFEKQAAGETASPGLLSGLGWLETLDQRHLLGELPQPQLHILAGRDALVPDVGQAITAACRSAGVRVLEDACHLLPLEAPQALADELERFLAVTGDCEPPGRAFPEFAKKEVAASFSRAAASYDSAAHLQREVGEQLLSALGEWPDVPEVVLDLGCGTGFFRGALKERFPAAHYIGLDLAFGMVAYARERGGADCGWLVGDAESLPLASTSVDIIFSSLALQWCDRPQHLFAELARVLKPGGLCVFTSLGPGTLQELRAAWAAVDNYQHVNTFIPARTLQDAAAAVPGVELVLEQKAFATYYDRVRELLDELKALGAHNMNRDRPAGLASRRSLQGMLKAYETRRCGGKLPATYDVIFGTLENT
jgi:malonyl-CoA O-methyltransferase